MPIKNIYINKLVALVFIYIIITLILRQTLGPKTQKHHSVIYGDVPEHAESKPVIVFIHGYNRTYKCWDSMYTEAFRAGYRTAFINNNPIGSIYSNARTLCAQIQCILKHYNVSKVICVCHSKGGLDLQGARLYSTIDMSQYIQCIVTLGTPNWGSPVANFMCHIAKLPFWCHFCDQGLKDLTTHSMQKFRTIYDSKFQFSKIPIFKFYGTGNIQTPRPLWCLNVLLNCIGPNDDLVIADNDTDATFLPYCHEELLKGDLMWNLIEPLF